MAIDAAEPYVLDVGQPEVVYVCDDRHAAEVWARPRIRSRPTERKAHRQNWLQWAIHRLTPASWRTPPAPDVRKQPEWLFSKRPIKFRVSDEWTVNTGESEGQLSANDAIILYSTILANWSDLQIQADTGLQVQSNENEVLVRLEDSEVGKYLPTLRALWTDTAVAFYVIGTNYELRNAAKHLQPDLYEKLRRGLSSDRVIVIFATNPLTEVKLLILRELKRLSRQNAAHEYEL